MIIISIIVTSDHSDYFLLPLSLPLPLLHLLLVVQEKVVGHAIALARLIGGNSPIAVQSCLATLRNQKVSHI